ncbi:UDP-glucose/GDP-mannose dehydrogenase family protein [Candidatus Dependentiae bacterium]|nr:UDP-glucose/GDP-mannose dehydrogenase family protein [Candidatus Dependentiae bacterium]
MKICVIGVGYVGLVTGTCFAELGNDVIGVDIDEVKIGNLCESKIPIYEPRLEELVKRNIREHRLVFQTDVVDGVKKSDIIYIAVGTPSLDNGDADLSYLISAANEISKGINSSYKIIVNKSTVPVGTGDIVANILIDKGISRDKFSVVSNPEFLREGNAINDFLFPDRIIIGSNDTKAAKQIAELYKILNCPVLITDLESAEMIKYASNAFLATKISFINAIANICERVNADVLLVAEGMGLDKRIGNKFLNAGIGYGGSCFPKDTIALIKIAEKAGVDLKLLKEVINVNELQKELFFKKIQKVFGNLKGKTLAIWGLAFKPNTDDMRDAPSIDIINRLLDQKVKIKAFDPVAVENSRAIFNDNIEFGSSMYDILKGADALLILTEWNEFKQADFEKIKKNLNSPIIIDGRNIYDQDKLNDLGFEYYGVGI